MKQRNLIVLLFAVLLGLAFRAPILAEQSIAVTGQTVPDVTDTVTPTHTNTPTEMPTGTITPTPTDTPTSTITPTSTDTGTSTATPTETPTGTITPTPTDTPTSTITPTSTDTGTSTATPTTTDTPTVTSTNTDLYWAKSMGGASGDVGFDIVVDTAGIVYTTGFFQRTAIFGNNILTSAGGTDIFVVKQDFTGTVLWATSMGGSALGEEIGRSIAVDETGNIYTTGHFVGMARFGDITLTSAGQRDIFVIKQDSSGNVLWAQSFGGSNVDDVYDGISVDAGGNVYTTGFFQGTANFGDFTLTSVGDEDIFVAKQDSTGKVLWAQAMGGPSVDSAYGIAMDRVGNVYITGSFRGTAIFGSTTLTSGGVRDIFVIKLDSNGNVLWARDMGRGSSLFNDVYGIAVDDAHNVYTTGFFQGTATFSTTASTSAGLGDVFVVKQDSGGNVLWAQAFGGSSNDVGKGIAIDRAGYVYTTGSFQETATFGNITLHAAGNIDILGLTQKS